MTAMSAGLLSKAASAYEHLRSLAVRGELRPGRRLSPPDVAQLLRISITPVRDALARLAAEGFITSVDGRGYFTKAATVEEQRDLERFIAFGLLSSLHGGAGRAGAPAPGLGVLEAAFAEAAERPDAGARCAAALGDLAVATATASGDVALPPLLRIAGDRAAPVRALRLADAAARRAELAFLNDLVQAMQDDDLVAALAAMRRRIASLEALLPDLVDAANAAAARFRFP